jgi:hypothetical protein
MAVGFAVNAKTELAQNDQFSSDNIRYGGVFEDGNRCAALVLRQQSN